MKNIFMLLLLKLFFIACNSSHEMQIKEDVSGLEIRIDTSHYTFTNCTALQQGDSLKLTFTGKYYDLIIVKKNSKTNSELVQKWSVTDSSWAPPVYKTIRQNLSVNSGNYKTGDLLDGKLLLQLIPIYKWNQLHIDTIEIKGWFKTAVK